MDALRLRAALLAAMAVCFWASSADAASHRTRFFMVTAPSAELARQVGEAAEKCRRELALDWLGQELPDWSDICPIYVILQSGAGGQTQFVFDRGRPGSWHMIVQGSPARILDSVIPHEVLHMVFATHFGQKLPRWADEGACTTVEHISERSKQERLLYQCLTTDRGIAFNRMFAMYEYPKDMLSIYAQGHSVARFLIALGGRRKFVNFVGEGLKTNNWTAANQRNYGFESLSQLQTNWLEWVRQGGREELAANFIVGGEPPEQVAAQDVTRGPQPPRPETGYIASSSSPTRVSAFADVENGVPQGNREPAAEVLDRRIGNTVPAARLVPVPPTTSLIAADSWYGQQRDMYRTDRPKTEFPRAVARPQPVEQAREVIIEWSHSNGAASVTAPARAMPQRIPAYAPGSTGGPIRR